DLESKTKTKIKTDKNDSDSGNDENDTDVNELKIAKERYIKYMDSIVEKIKKISWGQILKIESDPNLRSLENAHNKKYSTITKIVRFDTYVFNGVGSKNILRYFINKTKNDPEYGYQKIVQ